MRILHVVPTYFPARRYGGPIESVHALNKYLVRRGTEVTVYTTAIDGPNNLNVPLNVPVDLDGVKVNYFKPSFPRAWFYSRDMHKALKENTGKFDIMHITSVFLSVSTLGARAAARAGKPYIISPRGSLMRAPLEKKSALKKRIYLNLLEEKNLSRASAVHFTAEIERSEYLAMGLTARKMFVIPNGLDIDTLPPGDPAGFRKKFGIKPSEKIVLFLSRLSWKKGLDTLVDAFAGLSRDMPEAVLVIAGGDDENYRGEVEANVVSHRLEKKVIFTGELNGMERSSAYEAADVFCLPSYAENFGVAVAEAMYFGVPVVVSDAVGLAPRISEHEAGFVVRKDVLEVKFALFKILKNSKNGEAMGARGRRLVAEEFSYSAVADKFYEAYDNLVVGAKAKKPVW